MHPTTNWGAPVDGELIVNTPSNHSKHTLNLSLQPTPPTNHLFQPLSSIQTPRVEFEDREPDQTLLTALEGFRSAAVGPTANWGASVDGELIVNLGKYRRYDYTCLRDLLRVVRNKKNHFREMPEGLQRAMGPVPEGYYRWGIF